MTQIKEVWAGASDYHKQGLAREDDCDPMPYPSNDDLPATIRDHLPPHAQDIFRAAFNNAWTSYGAREPWRREEVAHRVAWSAVKRRYRKSGADWLPIETAGEI